MAGDTIKAEQTEALLSVRHGGEWQRCLKHEATTAVFLLFLSVPTFPPSFI